VKDFKTSKNVDFVIRLKDQIRTLDEDDHNFTTHARVTMKVRQSDENERKLVQKEMTPTFRDFIYRK
jgi:hypothetical protein